MEKREGDAASSHADPRRVAVENALRSAGGTSLSLSWIHSQETRLSPSRCPATVRAAPEAGLVGASSSLGGSTGRMGGTQAACRAGLGRGAGPSQPEGADTGACTQEAQSSTVVAPYGG